MLQVIDEAWAAVRHGARHFQASLKLSRTYGVSTWLVCHRPADLTAQSDDGTSDAKISAGLALGHPDPRSCSANHPTRSTSPPRCSASPNANEPGSASSSGAGRCGALQRHGAVVQTVLTAAEAAMTDTDEAMST